MGGFFTTHFLGQTWWLLFYFYSSVTGAHSAFTCSMREEEANESATAYQIQIQNENYSRLEWIALTNVNANARVILLQYHTSLRHIPTGSTITTTTHSRPNTHQNHSSKNHFFCLPLASSRTHFPFHLARFDYLCAVCAAGEREKWII